MLLFIVARDDPDRYRDLRHWFRGHRDVAVVLDRRYGERRLEDQPWPYERRASQRRRNQHVEQELALLGWSVVEGADAIELTATAGVASS
jgi:hypothetical protein